MSLESAVEGKAELGEFGRSVESCGGRCAGLRVRVEVLPVAEVCAAGGGGDVARVGDDGGFVDGAC